MECYEGATMIKTFRGLMLDNTEEKISLHTNDGKTGYRITKFSVVGEKPGASNYEGVMQIWSVKQGIDAATAASSDINFDDSTLLGVGLYLADSNATAYPTDVVVVFDRQIFNQDIYITYQDLQSGNCNYYLELEQVPLDLNESTVATLQSIRNA